MVHEPRVRRETLAPIESSGADQGKERVARAESGEVRWARVQRQVRATEELARWTVRDLDTTLYISILCYW